MIPYGHDPDETERHRVLNQWADRCSEWNVWVTQHAFEMMRNGRTYFSIGWEFWKHITRCDHVWEARWFLSSAGARMYKEQCSLCLDQKGMLKKRDLIAQSIDINLLNKVVPFDWEHKRPLRELIDKKAEELIESRNKFEREKRLYEYNKYLLSPEWKVIRAKVLKRANGICEGCGEAYATQVHHLTYDRLGHEMMFDLVAVCAACHDEIHNINTDFGVT